MMDKSTFEVIIIGGSYAGLSAAMALGRSLRKVLIIDSGKPCNRQTPHAHNFITQDGKTPKEISALALSQVLQYDGVQLFNGLAVSGNKTDNGFEITTQSGEKFSGKKLLFATGITDLFPAITGFAECWGISILHCPYCHGYEVRQEHIGLLGNGDMRFELSKLLSNWSDKLTLFTNGASTLTAEQTVKLDSHHIQIVEKEISAFEHDNGSVKQILFKDSTTTPIAAVFARVPFAQHCTIPQALGCEITEQGYIKVDDFSKTTVPGIYAAGDNSTMMRALPAAVAAGTKAGAMMNRELIEEEF
ncbi:NAD(P)/FAD-dependent oxidoreductase [Pontibacter rugosus]|uniref:NAD(P)/FAD-dependent oxidoreductase n=1 Tax=Pontibacter rugosus TaxID=1745966 RepID=A0ABW3SVZ9_9BACT